MVLLFLFRSDGPGGAPFDPSDFPSLGGGAGGALGGSGRNNYGTFSEKEKCRITEFLPSGYGEAASRPLLRVPDVQRRLPRVAGSTGARAWRRQLYLGLGEVAHRGVDARAGELFVLFVSEALLTLMEVKTS